jgi:hypothetical protein
VSPESGTIVAVLFAFSTGLLALVRDHFKAMERIAVRQALATERLARRIGRYMGVTLDPDEERESTGVHEIPQLADELEPEQPLPAPPAAPAYAGGPYHQRLRTRTPPRGR